MTRGGRAGDEGGSEVVVGNGDDDDEGDWVGDDDGAMEQGMAMELPSGTERTGGEGMSTGGLGAWSGRGGEGGGGGGREEEK